MGTDLSKISRFTERLPLLSGMPPVQYGVTLALCLLALLLRWELDGAFPPGYPYLTFFPAVIITSFLFGPRPGIVAAVLCGLFAWYFFIPPRLSFHGDSGTVTALLFYGGVVAVDIGLVHLMQAANRRLLDARENVRELAEERGRLADRSELLFQEMQHRVGNNLQMIAAVLSLQLRGLNEPSARNALSDAVSRLQVIGRIQRQLYRPDGDLMPLDSFIREVVGQLMVSNGRPGIACNIEADSGIVLRPGTAVPLALILSEAVANALEHGLCERESGTILVKVLQRDDDILLSVEDNGAGLPDGFDLEKADSVGLRISRLLSQQLEGRMILENRGSAPHSSGARMTMVLPASQMRAPEKALP
ncbi:histidine kinase [Novosphingobium pentaromativorans US6-1]|nr:histidine kinase [Novosphingobium pentaromativorans US6-1]